MTEKLAERYRETLSRLETLLSISKLYEKKLPKEVVAVFDEIADCEGLEVNFNGFMSKDNPNRNYYIIDGEYITKGISLVSANKFLKRLTCLTKDDEGLAMLVGDSLAMKYIYPKSFRAVSNETTLIEWG